MSDARLEDRGGGGDASADAGFEIAADTLGNGGGAAIGLKAVEIEAEALGALPEVRVVDVTPIVIQRVDHLEEASLQAGRLGSRV